MSYKYKISVMTMFKNESTIIEEWIKHNISEGIEHFYLIDNGSTDNYFSILNNYLDKITLVIDSSRDSHTTQLLLFNKHFLNIVKLESEWLIVCDIDEYIYSRKNFKTMLEYVNNIPEHVECITFPWKNFGHDNILLQPDSIICNFKKCEDSTHFKKRVIDNILGHCKSLTKTKIINQLNTHIPNNNTNDIYFSDFNKFNFEYYDLENQNIHINHYQHMSYEYYTTIKMIRGDAQHSHNDYTLDRFYNENNFFTCINDDELCNKYR